MIGGVDVYEVLNRVGISFALLLILIVLMYIAFWKDSASLSRRKAVR